ncbi:RagB/SusD family nutrient uptake outer membrane protein [Flavobacterium flavipallidum]|uniref:RagB/SusD family nutrient uptake outer membrane protein n=1 Tax=Flavobacterium flavipallidum TaxID=3139140 RepID=A0ABU9HMI3_9FLAO
MKKHKYIKSILVIFLLLPFLSCDNYLDIEPKGKQLLESVRDYNLWLDNQSLRQSSIYGLIYFSDVLDMPTIDDLIDNYSEYSYTWAPQLASDPFTSSPIWASAYNSIYYYNAVINQIDDAIEGTQEEKNKLKAEALLGRALVYLDLTNLYGKMYNETTAATDLAVPFVTSIDITDPTPNRSTVEKMYDHIIGDINSAIPYLPADNSQNRFRGSVAAAYALLARTYLYMGKYDLAAQNAQLALDKGPNEILQHTTSSTFKDLKVRPDAIYSRVGGSLYYGSVSPTLDLLRSYNRYDQRLPLHYTTLGDYSFTVRGRTKYSPYGTVASSTAYPNWGIDVAEMRLILAEVAARNNETVIACDHLDLLRKKRFATANYQRFDSNDSEAVLAKIIQERILEFPFCGLRWFDMKRLAAQGKMTTVNRYNGLGNIIATLQPNSDRYTLQIPIQVMMYNPEWEQNP